MKPITHLFHFAKNPVLLLTLVLAGFGCATGSVNPAQPKAHTGYVDVYVAIPDEIMWDVQQFDTATSAFKPVYAELDHVEGGVLRLAFAPGQHQLRVAALNHVIATPAIVEVDVLDAQVTPVQIGFTEAGVTAVTDKKPTGSMKPGPMGRINKYTLGESESYNLTATAHASVPYQPKAKMPYFQP